MIMVWEDTKLIPCPFCDIGVIRVIHIPTLKIEKISRGSSVNKRSNVYTKENFKVLENCTNCKASAAKIEKALNSGDDYQKPSRDKILERMKKAGLPTRV